MLQGLLAIVLLVVIVITIVVMVIVRYAYRWFTRLRDAVRSVFGPDDAPDGDDHTGRRSRQYSYNDGSRNSRRQHTGGRAGGGGKRTTEQNSRRTHISDDIVIIDTRDEDRAGRKIFTAEEGEYVEFEEM